MELLVSLITVFIFPGFLFLIIYSLIFEYLDRKLVARLQNRVGPPWYQPLADLLKLFGKEDIVTKTADQDVFSILPLISLAAVCTSIIYVPIWQTQAAFSFDGDLVVILYLLLIPNLVGFLAGRFSTSAFTTIGSMRLLTRIFSFEIPLFMAFLAPAILAESWSLSEIVAYYSTNPLQILFNLPALIVALIAAQGKLKRVPFDLSEAKTDIIAGAFSEYSGRLYAFFRLSSHAELVVISSIIAAIFLPFYISSPAIGMGLFILKTLVVLVILAVFRTVLAKVRIEQMMRLSWRYLVPLSILQIVINIVIRGVL